MHNLEQDSKYSIINTKDIANSSPVYLFFYLKNVNSIITLYGAS